MSLQSSLRVLALLAAGFSLTGCPLMLEDDFKVTPGESASAGMGGKGNGGQGPGSGTNQVDAGDSGVGATGGVMVSGGSGGKGQGGTEPNLDAGAPGLGGEGGAPMPQPCANCGADEECCNDVCVDTRFDPKNCRECGMGCPGTTCDNSSCTNTCALGSIDCNHNVVDGCEVNPATDPKNCGNCNIECGFGFQCELGYCVCPAGTADCDGEKENGCEVDTSSDKNSCGMCFKACAANQACSDSKCECAVGFDDCNTMPEDGCEADLTATNTCGSCGFDCGPHSTCVAAAECGCVPGYLDCDDQVAGCETPATDPLHCGTCINACDVATPVCDGTSCSNGCNGLTRCSDSCVDTDTDPENCGGCNKPVGLNQVCVNGLPECVDGFDNCDADPTDCEVNSQTDSGHCGGCGTICKSGAFCDAGNCACSPTTPNDCGTSCEKCCNDGQCSDGDSCTADTCNNGVCSAGATCAGGGNCCSGTGCFECCSDGDCLNNKVCSGNQCITLTCIPPKIPCGQKCIDPTSDANNCSGCGNKCGLGRTCAAASCTPRWVTTPSPLVGFVAREKAAYTAMGSKVFIWGGNNAAGQALSDGAMYDPDTDTWTAVGNAGSPPSGRVLATAVWTGSVVVVWGGGDASNNNDYGTGSRFDPATNTWTAMATVGAPSGRRAPYGFWTGSRVIFYSGFDHNGGAFSAAYLYDPVNNTWAATDPDTRPPAYLDPTVSWTGTQLVVYGGRAGNTPSQETYVYDLAGDVWAHGTDGPNTRSGAFGTWDGTFHLAWSGINGGTLRTDGKLYTPSTDVWTNMLVVGAPTARWAPHRQTGWSFSIKPRVTIMVGGNSSAGFRTDGGIYNSTTNAWTTVANWPSGYSHLWGVSVWTGTELVMWGGRNTTSSTLNSTGERYFP